jgi:hypothetical protein
VLISLLLGPLLTVPSLGQTRQQPTIAQAQAAPQVRPQTAAQGVRAERYVIDVRFEPEKSFLHAQATLIVTGANCPGAVELELNPRLKILGLTDAAGRKLDFARSQRLGSPKLVVHLAEPCAADPQTTLAFTYQGTLPPGPLDYITRDGILLRDESRWYPAVDLSAFSLNDFTILLPDGWIAVTGGLSAETSKPKSVHWVTDQPVSSRSLAAVPRIKACGPVLSRATIALAPPLPFAVPTCFSAPYDATTYPLAVRVSQSLQLFSEVMGKNVSGLTLIQGFPGQRGAIGYSGPGFLVVSEDVVKYAADPNYAPEFLPHEIAHQWFPIEVTLARQEDGWLAESLAEYLAWRYLAEKSPEQARRMVARAMRDSMVPQPPRPISRGLKMFAEESWEVTHETLYQRGLLVWRTLETVIDRERMDRALAEYYRRFSGTSASISDFRQICEGISGRNLSWFFDYFLNGTELPEIELRRLPSTAPNEMAGEIRVQNVPPDFQVRVELRIETSGAPISYSLATRGEVTPFTVTTPNPVTRVVLDPNSRILRWTEAARRNLRQRPLLLEAAEKERSGDFARAIQFARQTLAQDPENLASNEQQTRFLLGQLLDRRGQFAAAFKEFERVLYLGSLDALETDFHHAWAHIYRARILKRRGNLPAARQEARLGLERPSPALDTQVPWSDPPGRLTSAASELRALAAAKIPGREK